MRHQQTVQTYASAFATCDVATIVSCVSDDLVWEFNGARAGEGKRAFEARISEDLASGPRRSRSNSS
jgi:ketosteroid isomerase-like protein